MSDETETHDFRGAPPKGKGDESAGLVLLFAPDPVTLPSAIPLGAAPLAFGREPPPGGIAIAHGGVSRLHARIHRGAEGWVLTDLDSRNGTIVDGCKVHSIVLEDLDEIRIGDAIFKFVETDIAQYAPFRIDRKETSVPGTMGGMVSGAQLAHLGAQLSAIARSDLSVLIQGETGTGKELAAQWVHASSGRSGRFCAINCAAIPTHLLESELFGYKRGAFSGAERDKIGLVSAAHRGTLFLDEIGDLAADAQAKLLRVLETREVLPLGATTAEKVDVRVVSATHRDVASLVDEGRFRGDLFARVQGYATRLPPLRARKEDVVPLLHHFLEKHGRPRTTASVSFMVSLCHYDWPYNVRELEGVVRRAIALLDAEGGAGALDARHLPEAMTRQMASYGVDAPGPSAPPPSRAHGSVPPPPRDLASSRAAAPSEGAMREVLVRHKGNVAAVARELGKDRVQIHRWMKRHGLSADDFRGG